MSRGGAMKSRSGYTLLETLVALSVLMLAVVPLLTRLVTTPGIMRARDSITARCILEQEAALVMLAPRRAAAEKLRTEAGKSWRITAQKRGGPLIHYILSAHTEGVHMATVHFYVYDDKAPH